MTLGVPERAGDSGLRILCRHHDMSFGRHIAAFVILRRTIQIKLETVFLRATDVVNRKGDWLVRKGLNDLRDGASGLGSVDGRSSEAEDRANANDDREHGGGTQQAMAVAGEQRGGDSESKDETNHCGERLFP